VFTVVTELPADGHSPANSSSLIDQIVREGARKMLAAALQAEVDAYIAAFADERDKRDKRNENGRHLVVRNSYHQPRDPARGSSSPDETFVGYALDLGR
jgi:hypothetical protein